MGKVVNDKRCPKCGGNLYLEKDLYGWYEECLQCAYVQDLKKIYEKVPAASLPAAEHED